MTEKVYSYVVIGMVTGEHYVEDLKLRVPYKTAMPITENDFLNSKDLNRAAQQNLVKVVAQASVPSSTPSLPNVVGLERKIDQLESALRASETARAEEVQARKDLETKIEAQNTTLSQILSAVQAIPAPQTVVVQGGGNGVGKPSDVVGGDVPMFIPENIPIGTDARITLPTKESSSDVGEAAQKLRQLRKSQGGS